VTSILKSLPQEGGEFCVCLRESKGIREGSHRTPKMVFDLGLRAKQLFSNFLPLQICQLRVSDGMAAKDDPVGVQLSDLSPGETFCLFECLALLVDVCGRQENGCCESIFLQERPRIRVKVPVPVVKSDNHVFTIMFLGPGEKTRGLVESQTRVAICL